MSRILVVLFFLPLLSQAQQRIDGDFAFQSDPAKKYSIYVPSGYVAGTPHKMMLGFHPFNTNRWDAKAWCDTLIVFAETNNLLLICPDGGADGQVDDAIDTAFTSVILDSMASWYTVDAEKVYVMGFSWGGLTTYTYGLSHHTKFGGFMPIGAAISGTSEVNEPLQMNSTGLPFYLVHGNNDSPNSRFYPVRDSLISKGAEVNFLLMNGVGHTIDFPNRNDILSTAFQWIDSVNCNPTNTAVPHIATADWLKSVYPNPVAQGETVYIKIESILSEDDVILVLSDLSGKKIVAHNYMVFGPTTIEINTSDLAAGAYILELFLGFEHLTQKIIVK